MIRLIVFLAASLFTHSSFGQGMVNFNNENARGDRFAGIYLGPFDSLGIDQLDAQLFLVNDSELIPLVPASFFNRNAASEFVLEPVDVIVPYVMPGSTATFVYRFWQTGYTFQGSLIYGESPLFENRVGGGLFPIESTILPAVALIPEPSTVALGLLGAGALLLRTRQKFPPR